MLPIRTSRLDLAVLFHALRPGVSLLARSLLRPITLLATAAPGLRPGSPGLRRGRKSRSAPFEATHPEAAARLRGMQRDPAAALLYAVAGDNAFLAFEDGKEGNLLIHYLAPPCTLTIAGGWLGSGRKRYIWLPLRPTLCWQSSTSTTPLTTPELLRLAADLHTGLDHLQERHVLEQFLEPARIPEAERREVFDQYARFMEEHGWLVTFDEHFTRRSLKRTETALTPPSWSSADREALARMEALVTETLKGVRSSSRILYQTR